MEWFDPRCPEAISEAERARERSHVPYSGFAMGAAVVTRDNSVLPGTLVENVSLGLAMCPERVALFSAVARGAGTPEILALVAPRTQGRVTFPCGACLQVARELAGPELIVLCADPAGHCEQTRLFELASRLPYKD